MNKFVNTVTLQGQINDIHTHEIYKDRCVCFVLGVEHNRIECFITKSQDPDFYLQVTTGKVNIGSWVRLEGFLHVLPNILNNVICTTVAVLPE